MEITMTELFLFSWACIATGYALTMRDRFNALSRLLTLISTNREIRKDFFDQHDKIFGDLVK